MTSVPSATALPQLGVVVIGRNEGDRLKRCLDSLDPGQRPVVYVDSGSTDGSVGHARRVGADVVEIDPATGFTAARARNLGWRHLLQTWPTVRFVQFVDGDCEVQSDWLPLAVEYLQSEARCAGVCGRRRERYPDASLYNALCDLEWDTPVGPAQATGGDAMFRVEALRAVDGYRDSLIAGEEPEMCLRMRVAGWRLQRLDAEMTLHDAAMTHFSQWWKRAVRAGYAYAEGHYLHGGAPHHHGDVEVRRTLVWSVVLPLVAAGVAAVHLGWGLAVLGLYPAQVIRLTRRLRGDPRVPRHLAAWQARFFMVGRFAELQGWVRFHRLRLQRRPSVLIEYK